MLAQPARPLAPQRFHLTRRRALQALAAGIAGSAFPRLAQAKPGGTRAVVGAAWRGPRASDPNVAGTLLADWDSHGLDPHQLLLDTQGCLFGMPTRIPTQENDGPRRRRFLQGHPE